MNDHKPSYEELERRCRLAEARLEALDGEGAANRYRNLFDTSHAVMLVIDPDIGAIIDANRAAVDYYGWSWPELTAKSINDLNTLSPEEIFEEMQAARQERRRYFHFRHQRADGSIRDVEVHSGPVLLSDQPVLHSIIHDITDRKKAEDALRERTRELHCLLELGRIVEQNDITVGGILEKAAHLLPPASRFPESAVGRIQWGDQIFETGDLGRCPHVLSTELHLFGERIGTVAIGYRPGLPMTHGKMFLPEEQALINSLAERLGRIIERRMSNEKLRKSESHHRVIFEKSPLGMIRFSPDGTILDCNERFIDLMGSSREKLIGFNTARQSTPEMRRTLKKALAGDTAVYENEYTSITGGKTRWLRVVFNPVEPGRSPTEVITTLEDVSERKQVEEALKISRRNLEEAQRIGRIGSYERNLETGRGYWSDEHYRIFGYEPGEIAHSFELFLNHLHEEDRGRAEKILRTAYDRVAPFAYDCRYIRRDGEVRHAHHTGLGVLGEDGKSKWLRGTFQDITERKAAEEAVKKSEERYRTLLESLSDAVFVLDNDWNQIVINEAAARFTGFAAEKLLNDNLLTLFPGIELTPFFKTFQRVMEERQADVVESEYHFQDGRKGWYEISVYPVPEGILCISKDITERKRIEGKLRKSEARYRDIFNNSLWGIFQSTVEGQFLSCNAAFAKTFGYDSPEDLISSITDISRQYYVDPADRRRYIRLLEKNGFVEHYEFKARRKDGAEIWVTNSTRVVRDEDGRLLYYEGAVTDISARKEVEHALKASEARHRIIFEKSPLGMVRLAPDGAILDCNGKFVRLMGSSREKIIGFNMAAQSTPKMGHAVQKALSGETAAYEGEYTSVTGEKSTWLRAVFSPVDPGRTPTEIIATIEDVTDRKITERRLRESEQKFSAAFMDSPAILNITTVEEGKYIEVNDAFTDFSGYSREEALGKTSLELDTWADPSVRSELLRRFKLDGIVKNAEIQVKTKTGEIRIGLISTQTISIEGKDHFLSQIFDITDQRKAEAKLRESEERYRRLTENAQDIIWRTDKRGQLVFINSAVQTLLGYSPGEVIGLDLSGYMVKSSIERLLEKTNAIRLDRNRENHFRLEIDYTAKNGKPMPFEINVATLKNAEGKIEGFEGVSRDITERKQMERDLINARESAEAASRAKSEFIANMNHELRTPLNAILGYGQILLRDGTLSEIQRQSISVMKTSGDHLLTLINDILDIAKIEAGKLKLEFGSTDLKALIANVAAMLRAKALQKGIQLVETIDPELPRFVEADEKRLRQVLLNLLSNAVKFTKSGGVTLRVFPAGDRITFSVSDTGMGIPEDKITAAFDAFQQLEPIANKTEGTGLGLTISQNLVKLMGGGLTVESAVGQGSVFRFQIPLVDLNGKKVGGAAEPPPASENVPSIGDAEAIGPIVPPPETDAAALYAMSRIGDLSAIIDYTAKMRESDPQADSFCRTIEHYAAECDITAIRNLIEKYRGGDK